MSVVAEGGSFRDPAGFVFVHQDVIYRQINHSGVSDFQKLMKSGLYDELISRGLLVSHELIEETSHFGQDQKRAAIIKPENIPFISYPYEWSQLQLQAAAQCTLDAMKLALAHGMILKDASAYNVQFIGNRPVLIDTLSFTAYESGLPWEGYRQFCEHFVAPLALGHYAAPRALKLTSVYLDGIPLDLVTKLLPKRARLNGGVLAHLYLHNSSQKRHQQGGEAVANKARDRKVSALAMQGLISSLENTVKKLAAPKARTEWGDYYTFTNYTDEAFKAKRTLVAELLRGLPQKPRTVWDIGANNGEFSEVAAEQGAYTIAFDVDEQAVGRNFSAQRAEGVKQRILPLVQDLTNPSPALGWAHHERKSLLERGPADVVMALAVIHHLAIGNNLPFDRIADFFNSVGSYLIIEFVPKGDSKVDHLLASRRDIFDEYDMVHFEAAFGRHFELIKREPVKGSQRTIYLYRAR